MPYGKPVAHLREAVEVIRLLIAKSHTGELRDYHGHYYHLDFSELQEVLPPVRTNLPIWIAALRGAMVRLGAGIADGVRPSDLVDPLGDHDTPGPSQSGLARGGGEATGRRAGQLLVLCDPQHGCPAVCRGCAGVCGLLCGDGAV